MKHLLFYSILVSILLFSCKDNKKKYTINGKILDAKFNTKVFLKNESTYFIEDSTTIDLNGNFYFEGFSEYPKRFSVIYKSHSQEKQHSIWIENVPITVRGSLSEIDNIQISAGKEQKFVDNMLKVWREFFFPRYNRLINENKFDSISSLANEGEKLLVNFCKNHTNSYAAMEALYMNRNGISRDSLKLILNSFDEKILNSPYGKSVSLYAWSPDIGVNKPYIDFTSKTLDGKEIIISEVLKKGKPLLLIFGGLKCMGEHGREVLKKFHTKYKDKIKIFVFATNESEWSSNKKFDLDIPIITDKKGDHSPIKIQYNIVPTPTVFLIDKDGLIKFKSIGYDYKSNQKALKLIN